MLIVLNRVLHRYCYLITTCSACPLARHQMAFATRWAARATITRNASHISAASHTCSMRLLRAACATTMCPRWITVTTATFAAKEKKKGGSAPPTIEEDIEGAELTAEELAAASNPKDLKAQMTKHVEHAKREFAKLRGATASPSENEFHGRCMQCILSTDADCRYARPCKS
jgi:hypothetical protein